MRFTLTLLLSALLSVSAHAEDYYVSASIGDDDHPGSFEEPWLTVQFGVDQLSAGDTLHVMAGTYHEKVVVSVSGSSGSPITVKAFGDGAAVLDGTGITSRVPMVEIVDQSHLVLEGLTIGNNEMLDAQGVLVEGASHHVTIRGNEIFAISFSDDPSDPVNATTNAQPLIVYGTDPVEAITELVIDGNEIHDCRTGFSEGLAVNGNVDGFQIVDNYVHDLTNIGIDVIGHEGTSSDPLTDQARNGLVRGNTVARCVSAYATSGGLYVDGGKDIVIENNRSYGNGYGVEVGCEGVGKSAENIRVRNNLFYDNEVAGIALGGYDYPTGSGKVVGSTVTNNTFFANDYSDSFTGEMYLSYSEDSSLRNNIFFTSDQNVAAYLEVAASNLDLDYNLYFGNGPLEFDWNGTSYPGLAAFQAGTGLDPNSVFADPGLVSPTLPSPDLHLQPGSTAIDLGDPAFVPEPGETDIDGEARVMGGRVDAGADEHSGAGIFADGFESGDLSRWSATRI